MENESFLKRNLLSVISWYDIFIKKNEKQIFSKIFRDVDFTLNLEKLNFLSICEQINKICEKKRLLLKNSLYSSLEKNFSGKILFCEYENSLLSGESEYGTQGFFDLYDRPGWDTYFYCFEYESPFNEHIIVVACWIPEIYIPIVEKGIFFNPYGCIYWYNRNIISTSEMKLFLHKNTNIKKSKIE